MSYIVKSQNNFLTLISIYETKSIKKSKITKLVHAFKNYAHTYNVKILNSFNSELQLKKYWIHDHK